MVTNPLIKGSFLMKKMEGKGAWTYVLLPLSIPKTGLPFGWVIVKGRIDNVAVHQIKLWPTKEGELFLPIKASIRKKIKKEAGDRVNIELYADSSPVKVPNEFLLCLEDFPLAKQHFIAMSETSKKQYVDYIYGTKNLETRARRMTVSIEKLEQGLKYHQKG